MMIPDEEQLAYDIADDVHRATTHNGRVCHGDNDGCQGGPTPLDHEVSEEILERVIAAVQESR